jgi:hypothetical protein
MKTKTDTAKIIDKMNFLNHNAITGYAAKEPEKGKCSSSVHVFVNGRGLCGYKPSGKMKIQWCAPGVEYGYLQCDTCKEEIKKYFGYTEMKTKTRRTKWKD